MRRVIRAAVVIGVVFGPWWGAMAWWATFAPDTIVPKVLSLIAVPFAVLLFIVLAVPPGFVPQVSPEELEHQRWLDSWTPPPPQVVYVNQRDTHQEHLAEQARMFYLFGRDTPPTDWYPR